MKKFEAIETYKKQSAEIGQRRAEMQRRKQSAVEEVQALKAEYTAAVRKSITEGEDKAAEIEELDRKIEEAERTLRRVDAEVNVGLSLAGPVGGHDGIVDAWNTDFYPNVVMAETLEPALAKLNAAAAAYADEFERILSLVEEIDAVYEDAKSTLGSGYEYKLVSIKGQMQSTNNPVVRAGLTPDDLAQLARGERPTKFPKTGGKA